MQFISLWFTYITGLRTFGTLGTPTLGAFVRGKHTIKVHGKTNGQAGHCQNTNHLSASTVSILQDSPVYKRDVIGPTAS